MAKNKDLRQHPMKSVCEAWMGKIRLALEVRQEKFGKYAEEVSRFYDGPHDFMWKQDYSTGPGGFLDKESGMLPTFRVTINNVFKAVALFGPALYHKNPNILVSAEPPEQYDPEVFGIDPNDPFGMQEYQLLAMEEQQAQKIKDACAAVKSKYINWVQRETDKKKHARRAIQEFIVTGLGYLETTSFQPPASDIVMPRSTYVSWWDVVVDPDASYWEDVQWIAIRRYKPVNLTEERFGLEPGELKGHIQSFDQQATKKGRKEAKQGKGKSFDQIEYWEVFSKNGFGDLLHDGGTIPRQHQFDYSALGKYCWLAIANDIPYPLNCPTSSISEEDAEGIYNRVQWPIPFWMDQDGWPISRLSCYEKENCVWPISLFKPAIGEMRFVNWCMSFLADRVAGSCHTYVGVMKEAAKSIQKQLAGANTPFTVIELETALGERRLSELITFLQAPDFSDHIWRMLSEVIREIDEKTGVTELLQGLTSHSMRSAREAEIKDERVSVRPDDMAACTEDFLSEVAVREIQVARWFCEVEDVAPAVGRMGALVWQNHVMTADPQTVVRDYQYRVEAGSTRKPNKQTRINQLTELGQYALPVFQQFAASGMVEPYNAFMQQMCKALDVDPAPFMVQLPEQNGPSPEQQQAEADMQLKLAEFDLKLQEMAAKLDADRQAQEQELAHAEALHELDVKEAKQAMALKKQESAARAKAAAKPGASK